MKKIKFTKIIGALLTAANFFFSYEINAQTDSIGKSEISNFAYDRFGRSYSTTELARGSSNLINPCNAGFFRIDFTDNLNSGFNDNTYGAAMRAVVCQVFEDLSQLIIPANNPYTGVSNQNNPFVNIEVKEGFGMPALAINSTCQVVLS